jgi:hypothetical protein
MKVKIEIDCDWEEQNLLTHLSVIRKQIKSAFNKTGEDEIFTFGITMKDSNCYGDHIIKIFSSKEEELIDAKKQKLAEEKRIDDSLSESFKNLGPRD